MDRVAQTTHATGQQLSNQSMGAVHAVEEKASQAYRATVDTVSGAAHSVADQASQTYNATTNAATGAYTAVAGKRGQQLDIVHVMLDCRVYITADSFL